MKDEYWALSSTSLAHFSNDGIFLLYSSIFTYLAGPPYALNSAVLAYFAAMYALASGILSIPVGKISDSRDMDPELMSIGILILGIAVILFAIPFSMSSSISTIDRYIFAGFGALALGLGQAFYHPLGASILRNSLRGKDSSFFLGLNGSFGSMGRAILFFVAGILIVSFNPFIGLLLFSSYYFVVSIVIYITSRNLRKNRSTEKRSIRKTNHLKPIKTYPGVRAFLTVLTTTIFLRSMFLMAMVTYIFTFIDSTYQNKLLSFAFLSISLVSPVLGQPFFGLLTRKFGGNINLLLTGIISLVFFTLFIVFNGIFTLSLILFAIFAFAAFTGFPSILGFVGQKIPAELSSRAGTWTWGIGNTVGGSAGIFITTEFYQVLHYSLKDSLSIMLIFLLVSVFFNLFIGRFSSLLEDQYKKDKGSINNN